MEQSLEQIFNNNTGRLIHKWTNYFPVYERYFNAYRNKPITIVEIGVFHGGSLQMWKRYFGPQATIIGVDIEPACKQFEEDNIQIFIGSQSDKAFLRDLKTKIPSIDILIDDGGHTMDQQIVTFEELYDHIKEDGIYLCEDCHTSYYPIYGGGLKREGTFIEYTKNLIDKLTEWHYKKEVSPFTRSAWAISYYDSIVVIEKRRLEAPKTLMKGTSSFDEVSFDIKKMPLTRKLLLKINNLLAILRIRSIGF